MKKIAALVLLVAVAAAAGYFWNQQRRLSQFATRPYGDPAEKVVDVPSGTGPMALSTLLASRGVVSSADEFYAYVRKEKAVPKLKAGEYAFSGPLTPEDVLEKLVEGQVRTYRFTVPEGLRVDEIVAILARSELGLDKAKLESLVNDRAFRKKANVPTDSLEGFLYPDTYTFTRPFSEEQVLLKMVSRTFEEYRKADARRKPGTKLDLLQTITLASIIEKETGVPEERPRISCVFHNRLRLGMPLATDPTVIYAKMLRTGQYSKNITRKDLRTKHPYNTYLVKGLPPGPIASSGAAAIQAALDPLECDDLFFVSRNDGTHVFCPDYRCHEAAVRKWQIEFHRQKRAQQRDQSTRR